MFTLEDSCMFTLDNYMKINHLIDNMNVQCFFCWNSRGIGGGISKHYPYDIQMGLYVYELCGGNFWRHCLQHDYDGHIDSKFKTPKNWGYIEDRLMGIK